MATGFLLDGNGLSVKSYRETREALAAKIKGIFGEDLDLSTSSPDGQLIDLFCYAYNEVVEALQGAASSLDISSADGTYLDNLGHLMGQQRADGEDDDTFRARLLSSDTTGLATFDGMLTYLRNSLGPLVSLVENPEPEPDSSGIPGHSIAVFIPDTYSEIADDDIAQAIWNCKPAGIKAYGTESGTAVDAARITHTVNFFRVTGGDPFYMRLTVTEYREEQLHRDYANQLKTQIANWALTEYTRGKDIIPQRAIQAVYKVPGIDTVNVEVSLDGQSWTTDRIPVMEASYAKLPVDNISVEGP